MIVFLKNIKIKSFRNMFLKFIKNKSLWIIFLKNGGQLKYANHITHFETTWILNS